MDVCPMRRLDSNDCMHPFIDLGRLGSSHAEIPYETT
jgi:hypothetical protein